MPTTEDSPYTVGTPSNADGDGGNLWSWWHTLTNVSSVAVNTSDLQPFEATTATHSDDIPWLESPDNNETSNLWWNPLPSVSEKSEFAARDGGNRPLYSAPSIDALWQWGEEPLHPSAPSPPGAPMSGVAHPAPPPPGAEFPLQWLWWFVPATAALGLLARALHKRDRRIRQLAAEKERVEHELRMMRHAQQASGENPAVHSVAASVVADEGGQAIELRDGAFCRPFPLSSDGGSSSIVESVDRLSSAGSVGPPRSEREVALLGAESDGWSSSARRRFFRALRGFHAPPALVPNLPRPVAQRL